MTNKQTQEVSLEVRPGQPIVWTAGGQYGLAARGTKVKLILTSQVSSNTSVISFLLNIKVFLM